MDIICADLEGVFVPEIWINVAERTGIDELRLTTRDIADYDVLMKKRLAILHEHGLKLQDITRVIATMAPLEGALDFLNWLRNRAQVIIVSDTYDQFAGPLMQKMAWPTLFCHTLQVAPDGTITNYRLRQSNAKRKTVQALQGLNFRIIALGDSYNDIAMLQEADRGILFKPPANVRDEFPDLPATDNYDELRSVLSEIFANSG